MNYDQLTGADLAFIGDACYELYIRNYCLHKGLTKLGALHKESVKYVSRTSQYKIVSHIKQEFNAVELNIFNRGRNYDYKTKTVEYINASGFEAVLGYLYLTNNYDRLNEIYKKAIEIIDKETE